MFKSKSSPFEEDIEKATHENNLTEDWSLIMHICDNAINYDGGAKFCLKAIMKRLYHNVPRVVLQSLTLLDACVKNCDRRFLLQIASSEFTNEVQKLLPKMHPSASVKLKELIQRWSLEEFKDDPELCIIPSLYYKLKSEGVEFPSAETKKKSPVLCTNPDGVSSQEEEEDIIKAIEISLKDTGRHEVPDEYKNVQSIPASQSFSEPKKARALYDFDAAEDNELTIKTGEIVVILDSSNASWWKGSNHRGEGLFPSNFVTEDLDFKPPESTVSETVVKTETDSKVPEDTEVKLDEKKIEEVINLLNDTDPTSEIPDPAEMLRLEKECLRMAPIIEECLHDIDNRLAMLNKVNEEIMSAFDLFHSLSDSMLPTNQQLKYYPTATLNQHIVQFPHPQISTLPPSATFYPPIQTSVPQEMPTPILSTVSQSSNLPVTSTVQIPVNQEPAKSSHSTVNTGPLQGATEVKPSVQTTSSATIPVTLPQTQPTPNPNFNVIGGYYMPPQAIPYPVQYDPNMQQPAYIPNPASVGNVMTLSYPVPPVRPYFPVPYYYVNSTFPQNVMSPSTSAESIQPSSQNIAVATTTSVVTTSNASMPTVSTYSSDLHSLSLASSSADNKIEQVIIPAVDVQKEQAPSDSGKANS